MVRATSKAAFIENEFSGANSTKRHEIFQLIKQNGGCSRGNLARELSSFPINCVCGRVNELIELGLVEERGCKHDEVSGKSVNRLYAVDKTRMVIGTNECTN